MARHPASAVRRLEPEDGQVAAPASRGFVERLSKWLVVVPLLIRWLLLSQRNLSAVLPSAANPDITCSGLVGDGKTGY